LLQVALKVLKWYSCNFKFNTVTDVSVVYHNFELKNIGDLLEAWTACHATRWKYNVCYLLFAKCSICEICQHRYRQHRYLPVGNGADRVGNGADVCNICTLHRVIGQLFNYKLGCSSAANSNTLFLVGKTCIFANMVTSCIIFIKFGYE